VVKILSISSFLPVNQQSKINNRHSTIVNESSSWQRRIVEEASVFPKGAQDPKAVVLTAVQSSAVSESKTTPQMDVDGPRWPQLEIQNHPSSAAFIRFHLRFDFSKYFGLDAQIDF